MEGLQVASQAPRDPKGSQGIPRDTTGCQGTSRVAATNSSDSAGSHSNRTPQTDVALEICRCYSGSQVLTLATCYHDAAYAFAYVE